MTFYKENDKDYFEFNKTINKKRHNLKYKLENNNIQEEFNKFVNKINEKYTNMKIESFTINL
jgi:hypothetical protein